MRGDHALVKQNGYLVDIWKDGFLYRKSARKLVWCGLLGGDTVYNLSKNRSNGGSSSLRPFRFRVVVTIL